MIHNRRGGKSLMFAFAAFAMAPVYAEQSLSLIHILMCIRDRSPASQTARAAAPRHR